MPEAEAVEGGSPMRKPPPPPPISWPGRTPRLAMAVQAKPGCQCGTRIAPPPVSWPGAKPGKSAQPKMPVPAPVIQRATPLSVARTETALKTTSDLLFAIGKREDSKVKEVQAINIDGEAFYSANPGTVPTVIAGLRDMASANLERVSGADLRLGATKLAAMKDLATTMTGARRFENQWVEREYHAEQNLLYKLANDIAQGRLPIGMVSVIGTKPPCSICAKVLFAFQTALVVAKVPVKLSYNKFPGEDVEERVAGVLDISGLAVNATYDKFAAFAGQYASIVNGLLGH